MKLSTFFFQDIVKRHNDSTDELNLKTPSSNGLGGSSSGGPQPHPSWVYREEQYYGHSRFYIQKRWTCFARLQPGKARQKLISRNLGTTLKSICSFISMFHLVGDLGWVDSDLGFPLSIIVPNQPNFSPPKWRNWADIVGHPKSKSCHTNYQGLAPFLTPCI